jgi:hypothetical protein
MASIPSQLNSVNVTFKADVNNDVDDKLVEAVKQVTRPIYVYKYVITSFTVSSLFDSHNAPTQVNSRHNQQKAIDISQINGKSVSLYGKDPEVTSLVKQIQEQFEKVPGRRENFGPYTKLKLGNKYFVPGHSDHIHLSVN